MKKIYFPAIVSVFFLIFISCSVFSQTCPVSFLPTVNYTVSGVGSGLISDDFDGDGNIDLAFIGGGVQVMLGTGTGTFGSSTTFTAGNGSVDLVSADFSGDGFKDLVVTNFSDNTVSILIGTGSGSFGFATNFAVASGPRHLTYGDFNNDTKFDVAVSASNLDSVSVLIGTGTGSFLTMKTFFVASQPQGVIAADFTNDGTLDIVSSNQGGNNVSLLVGDGLGGFAAPANFAVASSPRKLTFGDFNGDGNRDVATANFSSPQVSVLLGTGTGSFGPVTNYVSQIGSVCYGITSGDYNKDGKWDLATPNNAKSTASAMLGDGTGAFVTAGNYTVQNVPLGITSNDFNNDGMTDLAVSNAGGSSISVLINNTPLPVITVATSDVILCAGNTATLTASGATTYNWSTGPVTATITVSPTVTTTYYVVGYDANACFDTTIFTQVVNICSGIYANGVKENYFQISPNPFNESFSIYTESVSTNLEMYNAEGKKMQSISITQTKTEIDFSKENPGIYFIRTTDGMVTKKLVKL